MLWLPAQLVGGVCGHLRLRQGLTCCVVGHAAPPPDAGVMTGRVFVILPAPQVTEHSLQLVHRPTSQSTGQRQTAEPLVGSQAATSLLSAS
mmetsp:Transcript_62756/g.104387  ORF Transcript_62756/g.104387 Transcript_62756/m.104387 type:complete len:91 (-) Transcript_62756:660-932(-)